MQYTGYNVEVVCVSIWGTDVTRVICISTYFSVTISNLNISLNLKIPTFIITSKSNLSAIALEKSLRRYLVSLQNWWIQVFASRPTLMCLYVRDHRRKLLTSSFLFPQHVFLGWLTKSEVSRGVPLRVRK